MLEEIARRAHEFDIIHFHIGQLHFPLARRLAAAHVTTVHGRLDIPELAPLYDAFPTFPSSPFRMPNARRCLGLAGSEPCTMACRVDLLRFHPAPGSYLAFLGRISPEKRVDRAIAIAVACGSRCGLRPRWTAPIATTSRREIRPLLDHPLVEFVGEIDEAHKAEFLGNASALLFPIDWPEPLGWS